MAREREQTVDIAKGFGIILVTVGHTIAAWGGAHETLHRFVYSFHMPLFLGISGIYISTRLSLLSFFRSKLTRFVIPFLFWVMFYFIFSLAMLLMKGSLQSTLHVNEVVQFPDFSILIDLFAVPIMANWYSLNNAGVYVDLWFLPAIFSTVILYHLVSKMMNNSNIIFLASAILFSYIVVHLNNIYDFQNWIPWSIDVAIVSLPFIIICQYRKYFCEWHWLAIPALLFLIYFLSKDMQVEVASLRIESYPRFLVTALSGIILVFLVSAKIQSHWMGLLLSRIGERTLLIFVLQGMIYMTFRPVLGKMPFFAANETAFAMFLFLAGLICTYYMYPVFDKHPMLRFLALGRK